MNQKKGLKTQEFKRTASKAVVFTQQLSGGVAEKAVQSQTQQYIVQVNSPSEIKSNEHKLCSIPLTGS